MAAAKQTCGRGERRRSFEVGEEAAHELGWAGSCLQVEEMAERAGGGLSRSQARGLWPGIARMWARPWRARRPEFRRGRGS
jgi:hypothetical protein